MLVKEAGGVQVISPHPHEILDLLVHPHHPGQDGCVQDSAQRLGTVEDRRRFLRVKGVRVDDVCEATQHLTHLVRCCRRSLRRSWVGLGWANHVVEVRNTVDPRCCRKLSVHLRLEGVESCCGGDWRRGHRTGVTSPVRDLGLIERRFSVYIGVNLLGLDGDSPRPGRGFPFTPPGWPLNLGGRGRRALRRG